MKNEEELNKQRCLNKGIHWLIHSKSKYAIYKEAGFSDLICFYSQSLEQLVLIPAYRLSSKKCFRYINHITKRWRTLGKHLYMHTYNHMCILSNLYCQASLWSLHSLIQSTLDRKHLEENSVYYACTDFFPHHHSVCIECSTMHTVFTI